MKHLLFVISAVIVTYLLLSLATMDLGWIIYTNRFVWGTSIPFFLFWYFIFEMAFHGENDETTKEKDKYVTKKEARKTAEDTCKNMFNKKEDKYDK